MADYDELIHISATVETQKLEQEKPKQKTSSDYFALAMTTFGVGYLPLMPGTFGSLVGVAIYLLVWWVETQLSFHFLDKGWNTEQITAWFHAVNLIIFLLFCLVGVWASGRATRLFQNKDPQKVVVDV